MKRKKKIRAWARRIVRCSVLRSERAICLREFLQQRFSQSSNTDVDRTVGVVQGGDAGRPAAHGTTGRVCFTNRSQRCDPLPADVAGEADDAAGGAGTVCAGTDPASIGTVIAESAGGGA